MTDHGNLTLESGSADLSTHTHQGYSSGFTSRDRLEADLDITYPNRPGQTPRQYLEETQ